ncbi:MAG: amidase [Solirubrobacteraceae bacterium]|jgi:amidase|nr:amidase [Solirubrobacteraceae bacterium]
MDDLAFASAVELGALMREGQISPVEVTEASLRRIEADGGALGAFVEVDGDRALAEARTIEPDDRRVFAGVPIAIKANTMASGWTMDYGSARLAGHRADHDAHLVRRLREEGFVIVGVTNMPEFGILPTSEPLHRAPSRNPWDTARTPGGSSGGAAAAVAAGLLPIAHGNDGGGSLRIPAACCGLVGLKPSRGRVSRGPDAGDSMLVCDGVLSRTVLDTAAALDALSGYEVGDATWAPPPERPFSAIFNRDPGHLRIGVVTENPLAPVLDPQNAAAVVAAGELLTELGHHVEAAAPALPGPDAIPLFTTVFAANIALSAAHASVLGGGAGPVEPLSQAMIDRAAATDAVGLLGATAILQAISRQVVALFAGYDVLLVPTLAERPVEIGAITGDDPAAFERAIAFAPWAGLFNVTGQPAISLPAGVGTDGLPLAIQLVGRPLGEDTLLQVATQIEAARPWALGPEHLTDPQG